MSDEITAYIKIKESSREIQRKMTVGIRDELNRAFPLALGEIETVVRKLIFDAITQQPEYISITNGTLKVELGLPDGNARLLSIIDVWINTVNVKFTKFRTSAKGLTGGIKIEAIPNDYDDVIDMDAAVLTTEKGEDLPWLRWLLLDGNGIIIADYSVKFGGGLGRTGGGQMTNVGSWAVPPQFGGTAGDNFVTRALIAIQPTMENEIAKIIQKKI